MTKLGTHGASRSKRLPDTTQDSLPVAGQALLDGVLTRKVPMKGFKVEFYIFLSPFPKLAWLKRCNRHLEEIAIRAVGDLDLREIPRSNVAVISIDGVGTEQALFWSL